MRKPFKQRRESKIEVLFTSTEIAQLEACAKRKSVNKSALLRIAFAEYLERNSALTEAGGTPLAEPCGCGSGEPAASCCSFAQRRP